MKVTVKEEIDKDDLYYKLSHMFSYDPVMIKKICESQFEEAEKMIDSNKDEPVKFPYIGKINKAR